MVSEDGKKFKCVLDTCSIIFLCKIELAGKRLIDYVIEYFEVIIPKIIIKEEIPKLLRSLRIKGDEKAEINKYLYIKRGWYKVVDETTISSCSTCLRKFVINVARKKIGEGELQGLAVAIYDTVNTKNQNTFLTDDFKARVRILDEFSMLHHSPLIMSSPDLVILLFAIEKGITKSQALGTLNDFWKIFEQLSDGRIIFKRDCYKEYLIRFCKKTL